MVRQTIWKYIFFSIVFFQKINEAYYNANVFTIDIKSTILWSKA